MKLNFCVAAWVVGVLCGACGRSRALPDANDGTAIPAGSAGAGTNIPDPQGGGTSGAPAGDAGLGGVAGTAGGAGLGGTGGAAGTTGGAGLGGAGGVAGTTGGAGLGGAGATTGGAGLGGSAGGGSAGAAGATPAACAPGTTSGQACVDVGPVCRNVVCHACSDQYWRIVDDGPCTCLSTGVWNCPPGRTIGDCFFDPPLDCDLAQSLYEDATCQTHPPCSAPTPP